VGFSGGGRGGKAEVTKAMVDLGNARLELNTAENELEAAKQGLLDVMGVDGGFSYTLVDDPTYDKVEMNIEKSIDTALDNRPELKSLKAKEAAMNADLSAARKEYFPVIFGRTAYRFKGEGAETPGFIAGIGLELNIFDGFKKNAGIQNARAQLKRSRAELETKKTEVESEIRKLHRDLGLAEKNISVTEETRQSSGETLALARERYRLERASDVELAEAEALYSNANAAYLQAIYDYRITAARLERAISGGGDLDQ
ncbi:MAG: TolC family protein, partial [Candidatus Dadabacteria bacterium]|nr:TolC family protein [Candidatus Dadabacteria bacterium]